MSQRLKQLINEQGGREADLWVDEKTKVIYFLKSIEGKKVKFSTKVKAPDVRKARREANRLLAKRINKSKEQEVTLIKDELAHWLVVKENEGLAYDTLNNVKRAKRQIEAYWGIKQIHELNTDGMPKWYQWWRENNPEIEMENAVKYLRNFCDYLASKIVDDKPLLAIVPKISDPNYKKTRRARKKKKERIITPAELKTIVEKAANEDEATVILIMYTMATRITETLTMSFGQEIVLDKDTPIYRWADGQNKADHDGYHALHPILVPRLRRLRDRRMDEGTTRLFPQQRDNQAPLKEQQIDWAGWRKRADLGWHWTPHTFRHTCLSNLFNNEKNPQALILKLYRVSLAVALETYVKPTQSGIEKMRTAIEVEL
jgi:integrase